MAPAGLGASAARRRDPPTQLVCSGAQTAEAFRGSRSRPRLARRVAAKWRYAAERLLFRAVALPPLRPAAFFCAVVPPCRLVARERVLVALFRALAFLPPVPLLVVRLLDFLLLEALVLAFLLLAFFPPRALAPGELAIFAARSLLIPRFLRPLYCFSFFTVPP
jgi:hypothetical protein